MPTVLPGDIKKVIANECNCVNGCKKGADVFRRCVHFRARSATIEIKACPECMMVTWHENDRCARCKGK